MSKRKLERVPRLYCVRCEATGQLITTAAGKTASFPSKYSAKLGRDAYQRRTGNQAVVVLGPDHERAGAHEAA